MFIHYIKGDYLGESRNADMILKVVSPYIKDEDCKHIKCTINQGCLSFLNFEKDYDNKHMVLVKEINISSSGIQMSPCRQ
jgi:hypothetical protein